MWLVGVSANAEVPDGVWTMPEPTGLEFTTFTADGTQYYLYNPGAKMFFASGNSWNTQASVRTFGYPFWLEPTAEADAPEGSYELWDDFYNPDRSDVVGYHNCFTDDGGSTWVDHGTQGNYSWAYEIVNGCVRFQNVALIADKPEFAGTYIGWTGDYAGEKNSSVLKMILPDTPGTCIDWKAVTVDSYQAFVENEAAYKAYTDGVDCFFRASELRALMVEAEGLYINITAALAVYNNTSSTAEQLANAATPLKELIPLKKKLKTAIEDAKKAGFTETAPYEAVLTNLDATKAEVEKAIDDLGKALVEWGKTHASVENPADMTAKIVNPNFDNASSSGWSGSSPNMVGSGSHGPANVAETWNNTFDMYQDIKELPAGVYALGAKTSWRGSWNDMVNHVGPAAKLYVVVDEKESSVPFNYIWGCYNTQAMGGETYFGTGAGENSEQHEDAEGNMVTYYSPNDPSAFRLYEEAGFYDTRVMFGVTDGNIRIGVKNPEKLGDSDNWSCYDTFTLTYYGSGADAAELYLNETVKNFSSFVPEEGAIFTQAYLDAYNALCKNVPTANSFEEATAFLASIEQAYNDLMKNIELWKDYQALLVKGTQMAVDPEYDGIEDLYDMMDYIDMESSDILDALELTNEELEAAIAQLNEWINAIIEKSKLDVWDGKDYTKYITNPGFDEDKDINSGAAEGWTIDRISGGNVVRGPLGESNQNIMINALGEQNFCFESWHCHKWDVWQEVKNLPVGMYELQVQGYVRCEVGGYTQGDPIDPDFPSPVYLYMNAAQTSFPSVYDEAIDPSHFLEDGSLPVVEGHSWTGAVENYPNSMGAASLCFKWGMYKKQAYGLIAKEGDTFRIGVKMDADQDWWCIWDNFKLTYREPTAELVKPVLEEELAKIDLNLPMGKDVYERAVAVKAAAEEAIAAEDGVKMFEALSDIYDLSEAINTSVALFTRLEKAVEGLQESIYDSDNEAAIQEAKTLIISILDGIDSHSFTDAEAEALFEKIEAVRTKLLLPANVMEATDENPIEVTAIIQTPSFEKDATNSIDGWVATGQKFGNSDQLSALALESWESVLHIYQDIVGLPDGTYTLKVNAWERTASPTYLYAESGGQTFGKELITQADGLPEGYEAPSTLIGAAEMFDEYTYVNEVVCKVVDNKLRIGIRKDETASADWIVMDNFRLFYHGANSSLEPTGDPSSINEAAGTLRFTVEYFTLDGRKATGLEKGILIQKMTLENGTVMMKKITK